MVSKVNLQAWARDAFCLCDSHPGEFPGGGNGIPMVHDDELKDSDTGRVFREDGDGSARTRIESTVVMWAYFICVIATPGSPPGGGNGMPMGHGSELKDSDTGRAFREDGDGSARTRIWKYRVDCYRFVRGFPPPMTSIGVHAWIVSVVGDQSGTVVQCSPSRCGCRTNRKAGDRPVLGRRCAPHHAMGAGAR